MTDTRSEYQRAFDRLGSPVVIPDEPGPDFRANAFVGAWDRITAAEAMKTTERGELKWGLSTPLPDLYWGLLAEAAILAQLASADEDPGRDAGAHLTDRAARISAELVRRNLGAEVQADDEPPHPLLTLLDKRVRINAGDFKGEVGTVTAAYPNNVPPLVDVDLDNGQVVVVMPTQIDDQGVI